MPQRNPILTRRLTGTHMTTAPTIPARTLRPGRSKTTTLLRSKGYPFSYDLQDIGAYYLAWRRLVDHWKQTLGNTLHLVNYETLTSDSETQTRLRWNTGTGDELNTLYTCNSPRSCFARRSSITHRGTNIRPAATGPINPSHARLFSPKLSATWPPRPVPTP